MRSLQFKHCDFEANTKSPLQTQLLRNSDDGSELIAGSTQDPYELQEHFPSSSIDTGVAHLVHIASLEQASQCLILVLHLRHYLES
jgi:hypothetical protein